jgi:putative PIN family toxin of toxin-antitoxin system
MPLPILEKLHKVVLDTNNLVSAQINKKGASHELSNLWQQNKIILYTSPFQLAEFEAVLKYKRIKRKYRLTNQKIKLIVSILKKYARVLYPREAPKIINKDSDDNQILAIAVEAKADFIISGDKHLLALKKFHTIPVLSAKAFLARLLIK